MAKKLWIIGILLIIAILCVILLLPISQGVKIGAILPLSGDFANFGNDVVKGINLYSSEQDCAFVIEDDKGQPKETINAFKKLSSVDGINTFYGPFGPAASETLYSAQGDKKRYTFIAMSMCSDSFLEYENMICNYPSPYYQLKKSFEFPVKQNKKSFYSILANDAVGESINELLSKISEEFNLNLLDVSKINVKDSEFYTITTKIIEKNPEFVFVSTMKPSVNFKIVKELKEREYKGMIIIGSDVEEDQVKEFEDILEGVYFTGIAKIEYDPAFQSGFKEKYSEEPNVYSAYGYMFAEVLCNNAESNILDLIDYVNSHDLAIKGVKYDEEKKIELPMKVLMVQDGKLGEVLVI